MPHCAACGDDHPVGNSLCPRTGDIMTQGPCGTRLDRYDVERWIGGGGMGAVYIARHTMLQHRVALKLLHPSIAQRGDILERFLREARATASLGSRHIVRVHDCAVTPEGTTFIAMEKLEGESLQGLLDREKKVAPGRAVEIVLQVLEGLGEAHAAGIVHRDMKPGNVFLTPREGGAPEHATILDFGISKMRAGSVASLTQTGTVMGTPHYMAPEQIWNAKEIDQRADIYAVGVMLYEMLAGRLPYEANNTAELLVKACTTEPTPLRNLPTSLPPQLVHVVDHAMLREPAQRYASAAEFALALRAARDAVERPSSVQATAYAPVAPPPAPPPAPPQAPYGYIGTAATAYAQPHSPSTPQPYAAQPVVWGAAPATVHFAPPAPATPRRRGLWIAVAAIFTLTALCLVGIILALLLTPDTRAARRDAGPTPSMVPINAPQTTQDESLVSRNGDSIVIHPGRNGVTLRQSPTGIRVIPNGPDGGAAETDEDGE